jgi:spore germination cell wall hydrolase CwlJ-like protein
MSKLLHLVATTVIGLMFLSSSVAAADKDISNSSHIILAKADTDAFDNLVYTFSKPVIDYTKRDLECLAKNIFYESGSESTEGKIAVGMVTINRALHPNFPGTICGVVKQKTVRSVPKQVKETYVVRTGYFNKLEQRTEVKTVYNEVAVCQFSWSCQKVKAPKANDPRWIESQQVAQDLLSGGYEDHKPKYGNLKFFHATYVRPAWHGLKKIVRIGGHVFYAHKDD